MRAKFDNYSKEEIESIVSESKSIAEICRKLDCVNSRYVVVNRLISLNIDISHLLGQAWNKGNFKYDKFEYGKVVSSAMAAPALIYKRGHKCEKCNLEYWNGEKIPLEVHHLDGDKLNNTEENLILLCPNCHALTDNYRGKNQNSTKQYISDEIFVEALRTSKNIRRALLKLGLTAKGGNYARARELIVKYDIKHLLEL